MEMGCLCSCFSEDYFADISVPSSEEELTQPEVPVQASPPPPVPATTGIFNPTSLLFCDFSNANVKLTDSQEERLTGIVAGASSKYNDDYDESSEDENPFLRLKYGPRGRVIGMIPKPPKIYRSRISSLKVPEFKWVLDGEIRRSSFKLVKTKGVCTADL